jgi:hypothetical protein
MVATATPSKRAELKDRGPGPWPGNEEWAKARHRDRVDVGIVHEHEEDRRDGSHIEALSHTPESSLPIHEGGRRILPDVRPKERER